MSTSSSRAIQDAFVELLKDFPANKITVKQLAETAGVTRSSFYNNFADIPALAEKVCTEYALRYMKIYSGYESFPDAVHDAASLCMSKRRVLLNMFNFLDRDISEAFIYRITHQVVKNYYADAIRATGRSEEDVRALVSFIADGFFGYVLRWLISGMREDLVTSFDNFEPIVRELIDRAR